MLLEGIEEWGYGCWPDPMVEVLSTEDLWVLDEIERIVQDVFETDAWSAQKEVVEWRS